MQGIFVQYGITLDDDVTEIRNGGFGSTTSGKKEKGSIKNVPDGTRKKSVTG